MELERFRRQFEEAYGVAARVFRAPGRVNLIGEHTDYNGGFVMPAAIDFYTWVAIANRQDRKIRVRSQTFEERVTAELDAIGAAHWRVVGLRGRSCAGIGQVRSTDRRRGHARPRRGAHWIGAQLIGGHRGCDRACLGGEQ